MLTGAAAAWVAAHREDLNRRVRTVQHDSPAFHPQVFASLLERTLPPLATGEGDAGELLSAVFDLLLLHAARDSFAFHPGLTVLFDETLPSLRTLVSSRPALVAALSNAVENLADRGEQFARTMAVVGRRLESTEQLRDAGALLAWRLGEARLRSAALRVAASLPPVACLGALSLPDWPSEAAPVAIAALTADSWWLPDSAVSDTTLASLVGAAPGKVAELVARLTATRTAPLATIRLAAQVGEFSGFGGVFDTPPRVVDTSDRHRVVALAGSRVWQIEADCFGSQYSPLPEEDASALHPRAVTVKERIWQGFGSRTVLLADGTLHLGGERVTLPALAGASSFAVLPQAVAITRADSHRIHVLASPWEPV